MNKNGVIAVVVVVVAIVLAGLWALRRGESGVAGPDCAAAPGTPQDVTYTVEKDVVVIRWSPAAGGERVATYLIEARAPQDVTPTTFVAAGNATTFQRQSPAGATYHVHMLARNACGTSPPSPEMIVKVP